MASTKSESTAQYLMDILNQRLSTPSYQMPVTKKYTTSGVLNRVYLGVNIDGTNDAFIVIEQVAAIPSGLYTGLGQAGPSQRTYSPSIIRLGFEQGIAAQASVTATLVSTVAANALIINGVSFAAVTSGATGNQWNLSAVDDTHDAAALAAAINGSISAGVAGVVTATSALGVVTVKAVQGGVTGNYIVASTVGAPITLGGGTATTAAGIAKASATATLVSAVATNAVTINGVAFTAVASGASGNGWNIGGTDTISATNLAAAINGSTSAGVAGVVTATSALGVVTVTAVQSGLTGNSVTFTKTGSPITVTGSGFLAGGTSATSSELLAGGVALTTACPDSLRAILTVECAKIGMELRLYENGSLAVTDLDNDALLITAIRDLRFGMMADV